MLSESAIIRYNTVQCVLSLEIRDGFTADIYDKALELINEAITCAGETDFPEAYTTKGYILAKLKRHAEAKTAYQTAVFQFEKNARPEPGAYKGLADAMGELEEFDGALNYYFEAIKLKRDYMNAYFGLAHVLKYLGKNQEALSCYRTAIQEIRKKTELTSIQKHKLKYMYLKLAEALLLLPGVNDYFEAECASKAALELDPDCWEAKHLLTLIKPKLKEETEAFLFIAQQATNFSESSTAYQKVLARDPEHSEAIAGLAALETRNQISLPSLSNQTDLEQTILQGFEIVDDTTLMNRFIPTPVNLSDTVSEVLNKEINSWLEDSERAPVTGQKRDHNTLETTSTEQTPKTATPRRRSSTQKELDNLLDAAGQPPATPSRRKVQVPSFFKQPSEGKATTSAERVHPMLRELMGPGYRSPKK